MARWVLLFVLATMAIAEDGSDVLELDTSNFEEEIEGKPVILVEFYAPWLELKQDLLLTGADFCSWLSNCD